MDIRYRDGGLRAEVGWFDRPDYYAAFHEFGTRSIPARPALGPAIEAERRVLPERIAAIIREALQ